MLCRTVAFGVGLRRTLAGTRHMPPSPKGLINMDLSNQRRLFSTRRTSNTSTGLRVVAFAIVWTALGVYIMRTRAGAPPPNPAADDPDALPVVFLDVSVNNAPPKRMTFRLRSDIAPKTAENFRRLCTGENERQLSYQNCAFHRIIPGFMAQAGDVIDGSGLNSESAYGGFFKDEGFALRHASRGLLSMANRGPNTNGSQFFITFGPASHLDGKHVVFGEVLEGEEVIRELEQIGSRGGMPTARAQIRDCGEMSAMVPATSNSAS